MLTTCNVICDSNNAAAREQCCRPNSSRDMTGLNPPSMACEGMEKDGVNGLACGFWDENSDKHASGLNHESEPGV
jgi:hypothetical protein